MGFFTDLRLATRLNLLILDIPQLIQLAGDRNASNSRRRPALHLTAQ